MLAKRKRNLLVVAMGCLVLAAAAPGWAQAPAKTPKDALANLANALEKSDKALFLSCINVAPADKELAGTMFDVLVALDGLAKDIEKAYGKDSGVKGGGAFPSAAELAQAEVKEEGDKATAADPKDPQGKPIPLVKKGGNWLVDMTDEDTFKGQDKAKIGAAMKAAAKGLTDLRGKVGKPDMTAQKVGEEMLGIIMGMAMAGGMEGAGAGPAPAPGPGPAPGPAEGAAAEGKDLESLWNDMIHFMEVARPDVAKSYADAILKKPEAAGQLYLLVQKEQAKGRDPLAVLRRAAADKDLKPSVDQLLALVETSYASERSDPKRIAKAIEYLLGTGPEIEIGPKRLVESGEYAAGQLVQALRSSTTSEPMKDRIAAFLPRLKLSGVRPLAEALQSKDPKAVERLATALGQIGYFHAAPMLKEVLERPEFAESAGGNNMTVLRRAVQTALTSCGGAGAARKTAAELYYELAEQYYYQAESLRLGTGADQANVWSWSEEAGLTYKPTPAAVFCDVYAMRCARAALRLDQGLAQAVSLWLAANLKRESLLPAGSKDTAVPEDQPPANYYALAAGAKYLQEVLERGVKDKNVAVATGAIEALARTAGAKNLVIPASGGSLPLVDAMSFGDGRVRFLAAVTLGSALPQERFVGWERVVPTLNDALLLSGGQKRAAMVGDGKEASTKVKGALRGAGWEVQDGTAGGEVLKAATDAGGASLIVIVNRDDAAAVVRQFRKEPWAAAVGVIVVGAESPALAQLAKDDAAVKVLPAGAADDAVVGAAGAAKPAAAGLTEEQQAQWAIRSAGVIRLLADTGNKVLDVRPAMAPLVILLDDKRPEVRLAGASALAAMPAQAAQQAIARLALVPDLDEKTRVAALNATCESVRRFGNMLAPDQETGVQGLVSGKGAPELRDAAAQLQGALSLSSDKVKGMILEAAPK